MTAQKLRLALAVFLFVGWIGFLGYLAVTAGNPIVLSRPQLLEADLYVVAKVTGSEKPERKVVVEEIIWKDEKKKHNLKPGAELDVNDLQHVGSAQGWQGEESYILALTKFASDKYGLTRIPPSPGYRPSPTKKEDGLAVYLATDATRSQLQAIMAQWGRE